MTRRWPDFHRPHQHCTVGDVLAICLAAALVTIFVVCVFVLIVSRPAQARWKVEYAQAPQATRDWYQSRELTAAAQLRFHFKSCCSNSDVVKTKFKVGGASQDEWWWLDGETWRRIPADIIHWEQHSPNGEAVLFAVGGDPVCFFPPESGI